MKLPKGVKLDKDGCAYRTTDEGLPYRVSACCYAAVTIDQDEGLPYCKKCYQTVSLKDCAPPNL